MNNQHEADLQIIHELRDSGSNMSKPHKIEHHFVSKNKNNIQNLYSSVKKEPTTSNITSTGIIFKTYFFDIIKNTIPNIENISPDTKFMGELAKKYSCDYDGWGCGIVK